MQTQDTTSAVPFFNTVAIEDKRASAEAGRPIFRDVEQVEVRIAGERNYIPVFRAHEMWTRIDGREITYAERWPEEYARFKSGQEQVAAGTPLSELPFLTEARRAELRAVRVYTAEALADLDGKNLSALGADGRMLKDQAATYLSRATGGADAAHMAARIAELEAQLAASQPDDGREAMKAEIASITGSRPRGNPSVETLREMLSELKAEA